MANPIEATAVQVPFLDLRTLHAEIATEILAAWREILENAAFVGGPHVNGFEDDLQPATFRDLTIRKPG